MNYCRFQVEQRACEKCGWSGTGAETARGDTFESLFEYHCPACEVKMGISTYPTQQEAEEAWDLVPEADRKQFKLRRWFIEACVAHELKNPDQLPAIEAQHFKLVWDIEERDGYPKHWTIIRLGHELIWSEPAQYEGGNRFEEVALILKQRYRDALEDLEPTAEAADFLYGDRLAIRTRPLGPTITKSISLITLNPCSKRV